MIIPLNTQLDVHYHAWAKYRDKAPSTEAAVMDLQIVAVHAANQAVADELGVSIDQVELIINNEVE